MLDLIMETYAWAAARPKHESANAVVNYEKKIADIMEVEKEQGTSPNTSLVGTLVPVGRWLTKFTNLQTELRMYPGFLDTSVPQARHGFPGADELHELLSARM